MAGNYARLGVGVKDDASGPLDRIRDKFGKLQQQGAKGFAIGAGAAVTAAGLQAMGRAAGAAVDLVGDAVDAASHPREAMALNDQVFTSSAGIIDNWADSAAQAMGESKTAAIDFASGFGNVMKAAGLPMDELAAKSIELSERATDMGSAFNASGEEVATAIKSGLVGESEPLRRFGVLLNEAKVKAQGMAMGLGDANGNLTDGEKVLARYQIILKESSESAGMFGRDVDSLADKQKILNARWEDAQAQLGEKLLPVVADATDFMADLIGNTAAAADAVEGAGIDIGDALEGIPFIGVGLRAQRMAADAREAAETTARRTEYMAGHVKDDLVDVEDSLGDAGDAAGDMAYDFEQARREATKAFEQMADDMADAAKDMIDDFFDPIETRARIYQSRMDQNAAEERLRDAETAREKREASDDIMDAISDQADSLVDLGKQGKLTATEIDRFETDVKQSYKALGKEVPTEIKKILASLRELSTFEANGVEVDIKVKGGGGAKKKRASGGPADGRTLVGEQGPEVVDLPPGSFVHNAQSAVTKGAMGGGAVYNFNLTVQGDLKARDGAEVLQAMRRLEAVARPVVMTHG